MYRCQAETAGAPEETLGPSTIGPLIYHSISLVWRGKEWPSLLRSSFSGARTPTLTPPPAAARSWPQHTLLTQRTSAARAHVEHSAVEAARRTLSVSGEALDCIRGQHVMLLFCWPGAPQPRRWQTCMPPRASPAYARRGAEVPPTTAVSRHVPEHGLARDALERLVEQLFMIVGSLDTGAGDSSPGHAQASEPIHWHDRQSSGCQRAAHLR